MQTPGFSAEASIHRTGSQYSGWHAFPGTKAIAEVMAAFSPPPGCFERCQDRYYDCMSNAWDSSDACFCDQGLKRCKHGCAPWTPPPIPQPC